jgi:hypothetical protein
MHFFDQRVARVAQDFRVRTWESIQDNHITQEAVASALSVEQSTVSRWMSPGGDFHLPAFAIPMLNDTCLLGFREDLLRWLVEKSGYALGRRLNIQQLNGTVADETMELTEHLGKIAAQVNSGRMEPRKARHLIGLMRQTLDRAEAELEERP